MDQYVGWGNDTMNQPASLQGQEVQSHDDSHLQNWKADRRRVKYKGKEEVRGRGANMDGRRAKKGASSECARRRDIRDGRGHWQDSI